VESAGFSKVSALGIEEQRVRVLVDLASPAERWTRLGHDFRVIARIAVWRAEDVVQVPLGALFRQEMTGPPTRLKKAEPASDGSRSGRATSASHRSWGV
jgi:hypothetical protein